MQHDNTNDLDDLDLDDDLDDNHNPYYIRNDNYNSDIYIVPVDGTREPFNLSRHPDSDFGPVWSGDGKRIAWTGRRDGEEFDEVGDEALGAGLVGHGRALRPRHAAVNRPGRAAAARDRRAPCPCSRPASAPAARAGGRSGAAGG